MPTVHPNTPEPGPALVDELVGQLRNAGVETSDHAVRVLALHAHRARLSYDQVVAILARFTPRLWHPDARRRAAELLQDIGRKPGGSSPGEVGVAAVEVLRNDVQVVRVHVQAARDDVPWRVLPSGDVDFSALADAGDDEPDPCTKDWPGLPSCLHVMAEGGIHPSDLCGACTRRFMAALDAVVPNLPWHQNYRRRAGHDPG